MSSDIPTLSSGSDRKSKTSTDVRLTGVRLYLNGFIYKKVGQYKDRFYWKCVRHHSREPSSGCHARATTSIDTSQDDAIVLHTDPVNYPHNHAPSLKEFEWAQKIIRRNCSKNFDKRLKKCTCISQSTKAQNNSHQSSPRSEPVIDGGKGRAENIATDPQQYHRILSDLSNLPILDQLFESIRSMHETGSLANSEDAARQYNNGIYTREECHSTTEALEDRSRDRYNSPEVLLCEGNETLQLHAEEEGTNLADHSQETLACNEEEMGSGALPPVPAAIPMKEFLASKSSSTPVIDLSGEEVEVKKEIELVDITDDDDVKQECSAQNVCDSGRTLQSSGECLPTITSSSTPPESISWHHITSSDVSSTAETVHLTLPHDVLNPNVCGSQSCFTEVPSGPFYSEMQSNMVGVNWCPPHFDQPHNDIRSNPNEPILISNLQIPFVQNNPSANHGRYANAEEFYTEIPFYRKPALEPRVHPQALD